ncbi:hypothetical protein EDB89DRAFT_1904385 [Lactarius sanguifluus]|nr:hypothetical protein EDB89DRAFT_1904385 [Lactarius sanguifluus]
MTLVTPTQKGLDALRRNLDRACECYEAERAAKYQRMPPAKAREEYEVYDNDGYPMEYDAWSQPLEGTGYDWYGMPLIWDDYEDCWCHVWVWKILKINRMVWFGVWDPQTVPKPFQTD